MSQFRKTSQQAHAFTREFRHSIAKERKQFQKIVPEFGIDPLLERGKEETEGKKSEVHKNLTGTLIIQGIAKERRELIERKHAKRVEEEHFLKF